MLIVAANLCRNTHILQQSTGHICARDVICSGLLLFCADLPTINHRGTWFQCFYFVNAIHIQYYICICIVSTITYYSVIIIIIIYYFIIIDGKHLVPLDRFGPAPEARQ